jgi:hypothetical protein
VEVRAVPIATIVQTASQAITAVATLIGVLVALRSQSHKQCRRAKPTGTVTKKTKRQKAVSPDSTASLGKPWQAKLDEAETLINGCHYRAAILILRVTLEHSLQEAVQRSNIKPTHRSKLSIQMVNALFKTNVLDKSGVAAIRLFSEICDRMATEPTEPSASDAHLAVELIRRILKSLAV